MKYIFEDSKDMSVSYLIKLVFGEENVIFTNTNKLLLKEFIKYDDSIVFVDVSPDNEDTVSIYESLMNHDSSRVYPYPCIEFVVLAMLFKQGYTVFKDAKDIYIKLLSGVEVKYIDSSLEKLMKRLLQSSYKKCFHNVNMKAPSSKQIEGLYYVQDCDCPDLYSKNCYKYSLDNKIESLREFLDTDWSIDSMEIYENISKSIGHVNPVF